MALVSAKALPVLGGRMKNSMDLSLGKRKREKGGGPQMPVWSASYYVLHTAITLNPA